ncbi:uroporphyrinogen-III synthase [Novosphingobium bradum]|uniref:Uroporphyrinogen-III synthase n=1 Tax=Novosphingobium bradum TaxID=1737444 RepID=A0ABV7IQV7_9SPHN
MSQAGAEPGGLPLIVVRPEPGCGATVAAARGLGLDARAFALFAIAPVPWPAPDPADFDLVLAGSANVFRHGGPQLAGLRALPVHAVGETTAAAARAAGFNVAATGAGGLQPVLAALPPGTRALRLAGAERIALVPPPGVTMAERTVYAATAQPLPPSLAALLAAPAVIALHSAQGARHVAAELDRLGLARAHLALATIGPRVTAAAGPGWKTVLTAERPEDATLLAKAHDLCQTAGTTG